MKITGKKKEDSELDKIWPKGFSRDKFFIELNGFLFELARHRTLHIVAALPPITSLIFRRELISSTLHGSLMYAAITFFLFFLICSLFRYNKLIRSNMFFNLLMSIICLISSFSLIAVKDYWFPHVHWL